MGTYLRSNSGSFLRNSSGKLLKQNYIMGNGFKCGSGSSGIYLNVKLRNLTLNSLYNLELCFENTSFISQGGILKLVDSNSKVIAINNWDTSGNIIFYANAINSGSRLVNSLFKKWINWGITGIFSSNTDNLVKINGTTSGTFTNGNTIPASGLVTSLQLNNTGVNISSVPNTIRSAALFYEFRLINRLLDVTEILYNANNGTFNDPYSKLALEIWYKFEQAEILDFSDALNGSDMRVGIRDFSGNNRHAEIINLPAGTTQEKCDYANANLFQLY